MRHSTREAEVGTLGAMFTTIANQLVYDQTTRTVRAACGHEVRVLLDHRALQDSQDANAVMDGMARAAEEADCQWCELLGAEIHT